MTVIVKRPAPTPRLSIGYRRRSIMALPSGGYEETIDGGHAHPLTIPDLPAFTAPLAAEGWQVASLSQIGGGTLLELRLWQEGAHEEAVIL